MFSFFPFLKYQFGYQKTQNFLLISNSLMSAFKNVPKEVKSKKPRKNVKTLKIRLVFWLKLFSGAFVLRDSREIKSKSN